VLCLAVVDEDGVEERKESSIYVLPLSSKQLFPLLLPGKVHSVLVECSMTNHALDVMLLLVSSSEAYKMPCEWLGRC
jgi:hypothetical protein